MEKTWERLQSAERAARAWYLVSRIAERVAPILEVEAFRAALFDALASEIPIDDVSCGFLGEPSCPADVRAAAATAAPNTIRELSASQLFVPFAEGGAVIGGLIVTLRPTRGALPDDADVQLMLSLAPHIMNAASRSRYLRASAELAIAKERIVTLAVHDLKNPLSVVRANIDVARDEPDEAERGAALDDARAAAEQLLGMLVDLLDLSRAESGELKCVLGEGDLASCVRTTAERFRVVIEKRPAKYEVRLPPVAHQMRALFDERLIVRVLQNLLTNASRFVPADGVVEVDVSLVGGAALIRVSNDGPSIDPNVRRHLFDRYGVVAEGQTHANRGLGLYLCRLVMEQHGGSISVHERAERGVSFEVRIPLRA